MKNTVSPIDNLSSWVVMATVFLTPLFFLPLTADAFELPKFALVTVATVLLIFLWIGRSIQKKEVSFTITPFTLPLFLFSLAQIASLLIVSPNKIQPWLTPGSVGSIIVLWLFLVLVSSLVKTNPNLSHGVKLSLAASAIFSSVIALASLTGYTADYFLPLGSPLTFLTTALVLLVVCAASLIDLVQPASPHHASGIPAELVEATGSNLPKTGRFRITGLQILAALATLCLLIAAGLTIYRLLTTARPVILPHWAGWAVTLEGLKDWQRALFGVGPGNFLAAFTRGKPVELNLTNIWNLRFAASSNFYLQLFSETGLLAGLAFGLFLYQAIRAGFATISIWTKETAPLALGILTILVIQLFAPGNFSLLFYTFLLAGLLGGQLPKSTVISERSQILPLLIAGVSIVIIAPSLYLAGRAYEAEILFKQTLDAISANQADVAYDKNIKALQTNPYVDLYHLVYSQTNLAIAVSLSQQENIDDETRSNISRLIQQAIREAKSAVAANPTKAGNWENLAATYRSLINIAEGSEDWTVQVYQQAIRLDPVNPLLRLNLGGVFFRLGRFAEAIDQFKIAVALKRDFANGYYNLAAAYRAKGELNSALAALKQTIQYLPTDAPDYAQAQQELEELTQLSTQPETTQPTIAATSSGELLTLPATDSARLEPPLALPTEAAPPTSPEEAEEEPVASPTPENL